MAELTLKRTPLYERHVAAGAKMMSFAGFDMPVQYAGIIEEHNAVRSKAGVFDVSHMGEFRVRGDGAAAALQRVVTNDVSKLFDGRAMYTVMCLPSGGIVDDLIVYRISENDYLMVVNAANIETDYAWVTDHLSGAVSLTDVSDNVALLAVQGPRAIEIVQATTTLPVSELKFYHFVRSVDGSFFDCDEVIISATGYTGEPGVEIYCDPDRAPLVWDALLEAGSEMGLTPAGLGARDTLRMEAGYCLYGNDITHETNPVEAGLGWICKTDKGDFIGRDAIVAAKESGTARRLVAFKMTERGIPRTGYEILDAAGAPVGTVTSGTQSPILDCGIGLGYVQNKPTLTTPGAELQIAVRNRRVKAVVAKPPLHKS